MQSVLFFCLCLFDRFDDLLMNAFEACDHAMVLPQCSTQTKAEWLATRVGDNGAGFFHKESARRMILRAVSSRRKKRDGSHPNLFLVSTAFDGCAEIDPALASGEAGIFCLTIHPQW